MSRVTNNVDEFMQKVLHRLTAGFEDGLILHWTYLEWTSIPYTARSVSFGIKGTWEFRKLIVRNWVMEDDEGLGIFHLDKIPIAESEGRILSMDLMEIRRLLALAKVEKTQKVVIDGARYELRDYQSECTYHCTLDEQLNPELLEAVDIIRRQPEV